MFLKNFTPFLRNRILAIMLVKNYYLSFLVNKVNALASD